MTLAKVHNVRFKAMACACEISVGIAEGQKPDGAQEAAVLAIAEVRRIEKKYSRYRDNSVIGLINAAAGQQPTELDSETLRLLEFADRMHSQSDGLFDISSGVYRHAWDFKSAQLPSPAQLEELRPLVGWEKVQLEGNMVFLPLAGMEIDFGGFGKEYAADRAAMVLQAQGVKHALVNLGGDLASLGAKPDGKPWIAGIQHPREPTRLIATLDLSGQALATSGDYERYFEQNSQRYCHILDPHTGWPVQHFQSVSVVAPSCLLAGAVSTTIMLKQALATADWIGQLDLPVLWVDYTGQARMHSSGSLAQKLTE